MAGYAFMGGQVLTLDAKGRVVVPARWRDELMAAVGGQMVLCYNRNHCLSLYPQDSWAPYERTLYELPESEEGWVRLVIGTAEAVEIDSASRLLVSPELRELGGLTRDVRFIGMRDHFELWDQARYMGHLATVAAGGPPAVLAQRKPTHTKYNVPDVSGGSGGQ